MGFIAQRILESVGKCICKRYLWWFYSYNSTDADFKVKNNLFFNSECTNCVMTVYVYAKVLEVYITFELQRQHFLVILWCIRLNAALFYVMGNPNHIFIVFCFQIH